MPEHRHHSRTVFVAFLLLRFIVSVSYGALLLWSAFRVLGVELEWWRALLVNVFAVAWVVHYETNH